MSRTRADYLPADCEEWMKKCFNCKHCYMYKDTCDWYCSIRGDCKYEPISKTENCEQEHNGCEYIKGRRMTDAESMGMLFDDAPNID